MSGRSTTVRFASKNVIKLDYNPPELECQYPGSWFQTHKMKPTATIKKCKSTIEELRAAIVGGIATSTLTLDSALSFIYQFMQNVKGTCSELWTSFGITIGNPGSEITPWNVITIQESGEFTPTEKMSTIVNVTDDKALVLALLAVYRLSKITNSEYLARLESRFRVQLIALGGKDLSVAGWGAMYAAWSRDPNYLKMVAGIDMFFYHFKRHPLEVIKMGTISSRYRNCAALTSFEYAIGILALSPTDLMRWAFVAGIGDDLERMFKDEQEIEMLTSYFPYQTDLGLVDRTSYSAVINSQFFHWVHFICALLGCKRSQNARFNLEQSLINIISTNAILVAWVFDQVIDFQVQFSADGQDYGAGLLQGEPAKQDSDDEETGSIAPPRQPMSWEDVSGKDPSTWYAVLKSNNFKIPPLVKERIKKIALSFTETRQGTIGEYIKKNFVY